MKKVRIIEEVLQDGNWVAVEDYTELWSDNYYKDNKNLLNNTTVLEDCLLRITTKEL